MMHTLRVGEEERLIVAVPSDCANIATWDEEAEEYVAVPGGGFQLLEGMSLTGACEPEVGGRPISPPAGIKAPSKKRGYFVDRCQNTQCTFAPGHTGMCSHMIVTGKRFSKMRVTVDK